MRLAEVAGKQSCQMSLSPAHGIFLLKGARFSSPKNGAAPGQNNGLGLEGVASSCGFAILSRPTYRTVLSPHLHHPQYNSLPGVTPESSHRVGTEWLSISSFGPDLVVTVATRLTISPQLPSFVSTPNQLWELCSGWTLRKSSLEGRCSPETCHQRGGGCPFLEVFQDLVT